MGGCQNYGSFLGTLNIRCRVIMGIQKGAMILTTTHILGQLASSSFDSNPGSQGLTTMVSPAAEQFVRPLVVEGLGLRV